MTPGALHHVEIYVSDLSRSMSFWTWLLTDLGYELSQQWSEGQSWMLGETYLVFVQVTDKHKEAGYNRCRVGLNHLAFHARSREHVDQITDELKARGQTVLYEDLHPFASGPETYGVFFEDPDRMKVELVAPPITAAAKQG